MPLFGRTAHDYIQGDTGLCCDPSGQSLAIVEFAQIKGVASGAQHADSFAYLFSERFRGEQDVARETVRLPLVAPEIGFQQ